MHQIDWIISVNVKFSEAKRALVDDELKSIYALYVLMFRSS